MKSKPRQSVLWPAILISGLLIPLPVYAQRTTLSGTITDSSGAPVASAKISVKNLAADGSTEAQADAKGLYNVPNLSPGNYEVSVSAEGFTSNTAKLTISSGANQTANFTLSAALSLKDLGFPGGQTQGSPQEQARLDKRSHMLKIHQRIGLIATVPIVASVVTGPLAGGKSTSSTARWVHLGLGSAAGDLYFLSAYYAIRAPKISGTRSHGPIRLHKALAWIHGPGMVLTPILGALAFEQKSKGEKLHGIASAHGPVAIVTASAYGAAILSVSLKF